MKNNILELFAKAVLPSKNRFSTIFLSLSFNFFNDCVIKLVDSDGDMEQYDTVSCGVEQHSKRYN